MELVWPEATLGESKVVGEAAGPEIVSVRSVNQAAPVFCIPAVTPPPAMSSPVSPWPVSPSVSEPS